MSDAEPESHKQWRAMRSSFWVPDYNPLDWLEFPGTKTKWRPGRIFKERELHQGPDSDLMSEASAICVATQIDGPNVGLEAILKIRMQIPRDIEDEDEPDVGELGEFAETELRNLNALTQLGCSCTPKLLDFMLGYQADTDPVPGGFILWILMEKLPGRDLVNFGDLPMSERDEVRIAFVKALRELFSYEYKHYDADRRNLIWDAKNKKCYIIDLENVYRVGHIGGPLIVETYDIFDWRLAGVGHNHTRDGIDPMVPDMHFPLYSLDDEGIRKLATDAVGKEKWFLKR